MLKTIHLLSNFFCVVFSQLCYMFSAMALRVTLISETIHITQNLKMVLRPTFVPPSSHPFPRQPANTNNSNTKQRNIHGTCIQVLMHSLFPILQKQPSRGYQERNGNGIETDSEGEKRPGTRNKRPAPSKRKKQIVLATLALLEAILKLRIL